MRRNIPPGIEWIQRRSEDDFDIRVTILAQGSDISTRKIVEAYLHICRETKNDLNGRIFSS